ncbi:MAG: ribosome maturation factor RimM [Clostridia bacterium]
MLEKYLEIGKIVGTHGINGEVKMDVWADSADLVKKLKTLYFEKGTVKIEKTACRIHKNQALLTIKDITDPSKADLLRGKIVYMDRNEVRLPKNRFFVTDLIGLKAYDGKTKEFYGEITEVFQTGANNVYKIEKDGKEYLFPAVDHMIKNTDIENGIIELLPISGIFDGQEYSDAN